MKTTVHIISHSHWDREWYQSFEKHRMKLIELVDNILEKAENDPEFGGFFLDGQTIALDDYLEVRPEKREQVEKCVREGKIQTGPWYILQDEFLTSGEACVRNLQVGMQEAARYGAIGNVGYFPDAFGNARRRHYRRHVRGLISTCGIPADNADSKEPRCHNGGEALAVCPYTVCSYSM